MRHTIPWVLVLCALLSIFPVLRAATSRELAYGGQESPSRITASRNAEITELFDTIEILSDTTTEWLSDTGWSPTVLAWVHPDWPTLPGASWVWKSYITTPQEALSGSAIISLRRQFKLPSNAVNATGSIQITADNAYELSLNGTILGSDGVLGPNATDKGFASIETYGFVPEPGDNEFTIRMINYKGTGDPYSNPSALLFRAEITYSPIDCSESPVYSGISHCTRGAAHILKINPKAVRFETTLAMGYDKNDVPGECRDVNTPAGVPVATPGPRCHIEGDDTHYPAELVGEMAIRNPDNAAAVAFNTDYFEPSYLWGPQGLTVKNGARFDGLCYGDDDDGAYNAMNRPSLAISAIGAVTITIAGADAPNNCNVNNEPYVIDSSKYWNTVGGGPLLVENGVSVVERECKTADQYCPDPSTARARTAVGTTADGELIVVVVPQPPGIILDDRLNPEAEDLAELMMSLGAVEAMNFDGGGSSQLWYNGDYLVSSSDPTPRPVPEAMLVFANTICPAEAALSEETSASEYETRDAVDLLSLYWQLRDDVLSTSDLGQGYIEDYGQYGPEVTEILLTDSGLRSRAAQFLENAAPAFGSLLPGSTAEVELTQALYDEAEGLVHDLAYAGSQELQEVMFQTWEDLALDEHIGETATEIWQQMPHHTVYLPLILR